MEKQTLKNCIALGLALLTVGVNGLIGHFLAPGGILLTPLVLALTTALVVFGTEKINAIGLSALTYLFVALNDIAIKLWSGGSHDSPGLGWIHLMLFIGLVPACIFLFRAIVRRRNDSTVTKIIAIGLFAGLIVLHLYMFGKLGLGPCVRC